MLERVGYGTIIQDPKRILETPSFKQALQETGLRQALIEQGINPAKIAEKIDTLLNAVDKEGIQDYTAIDKGLKHATAIYGITEDKPKETGATYNFIFNPEVQERVRVIDDEIKSLLTKKHVQED